MPLPFIVDFKILKYNRLLIRNFIMDSSPKGNIYRYQFAEWVTDRVWEQLCLETSCSAHVDQVRSFLDKEGLLHFMNA